MSGFARLLRAEWTKLRTVRGWLFAMPTAAVLIVAIGLFTASGAQAGGGCAGGKPDCGPPKGPDGEAVEDGFTFVHRALAGNGTITARVAALTGGPAAVPSGSARDSAASPQPWAKTGLIVKAGTAQGSRYAAVLLSGAHGVRLQADFTHDTPAPESVGARPPHTWLRLTRDGADLTGYASSDDTHWTPIGTAHLPGLPGTVQAGLFTASPDSLQVNRHFLGESASGGPARATGTLDHVSLEGDWQQEGWHLTRVGGDPTPDARRGAAPGPAGRARSPAPSDAASYEEKGGRFTVTGSGDIAPVGGGQGVGPGRSVESGLVGTFAGLVVLIVLGTSFVTAEYRRGLIRTTLSAEPRRGRVLAAKAVVTGVAAFTVGAVASWIAVVLCDRIFRHKGVHIQSVGTATQLRVVLGTALLLAAAAVLALAAGVVLRRAAGAVAAVTAAVVLPYLLAVSSAVPPGPAAWLLRVTPAAAFAMQQTLLRYPQVAGVYTPSNGYYPLSPWEGLGVLSGWTALALALAYALLRRRDA